MKVKVNLLLGQNLDNCSILNINFIDDKIIGVASFTSKGCLINVYGDNELEYKSNLYKMIYNGLYVIIGGISNLELNKFGECSISNKELLNKAINYVKQNNIECNEMKKTILDELDYMIEGKSL